MKLLLFSLSVFLSTTLAQSAGQSAPDFRLMSTDGKVVTLSALRGKPVVVNFWASWCPSCQAEFPDLHRAYLKSAGALNFLAINLNEPPEVARDFMKTAGYTFLTLVNPQRGQKNVDDTLTVARRYAVLGQPVTVFIDAKGTIQAVYRGQLSSSALQTYLTQLGLGAK